MAVVFSRRVIAARGAVEVQLALLVALAAGLGCHGNSTTAPTTTAPAPVAVGLRTAAAGKLIGTAVQSGYLSDSRYHATFARDFNYVTAEYEMKWNVIESSRGVNNYSAGDAIVSDAQGQGMQVKGHTLIWHGSNPVWLGALPAAEFRAAFEEHIRAVAGHYRGRVLAWDVVNEAMADDGSGLRDTVFRQQLGDDYIADAFRLAHEADPQALLFYNDYNGEGLSAKSDRIYDLVRTLRAQGVPIDGVGLQVHVSATGYPSLASLASNMRRLAGLGLLVNISEMDVKIANVPGSSDSRLAAQRTAYHDIVGVCVAEPGCHAVTFWGFTDAHTWIAGDDPLLYDRQYAQKPAFFGVFDALSRK